MDSTQANLMHSGLKTGHFDGNQVCNGRMTPPSSFTDSYSAPTVSTSESASASASVYTTKTDLTSPPSDVSQLSLETVKRTPLGEPPAVSWPYSHSVALDDIPGIAYALDLFLKSLMVESEEYCHRSDPKKERLYFATGYGMIQCVKALMSYEDDDLLSAIGHAKHGNIIANEHRKKAASLPFRLAGFVTGSSGVNWIKSMTPVERHAELVYAESLFEKALLGIVYSGDWLAFIKEVLNMRSTMQIYRQLGKYLDEMDAKAEARGEGPEDKSIDVHFRSGVHLGVGLSHIVISLMPAKLATVVEFFGYKGDRHLGLALLEKVGGWTKESSEPSVSQADEGARRSICDMALLIFHLFLSSFTHDGVDVMMAQKIVDWNLKCYPEGVFFLLAQGRLSLCRSQPARAIACYQKAMTVQSQYRNLHHVSFWEMAVSNLALWEIEESLKSWRNLHKESTWSKAVYAYGVAALLMQQGGEAREAEGLKLMIQVPKLRQHIAGKSIPLEKFVARKARKCCEAQDGRLLLPALELAYISQAVARAPRSVIAEKMLPLVEAALAELKQYEDVPQTYGKGKETGTEFWEDLCLARHLEGACLRYIAYPGPYALSNPDEVIAIPQAEAAKRASAAFEAVFASGTKIELDHYIVYHAHFEYGRLLACMGLVMSGKPLEVNVAARKGKYSLESELLMRTNAALEALEQEKRL
ncbi:hypothetical protein B0F90DRAFT_1811542 [Multifurca ochricompacta]|uniref:Tetratricopeptide repeat protein 39B n=1 Tax=Multifurca ochricompacta TaxID=376703 RepID=A0AAD4QKU3_9AGAM|nr:hypothetical protein B0F90DRAFT_1811542 [Multifurca ochricompacta]